MPETIGGVPLHPLVVHAVVVLVPLAALGVAALSVVPRWRGRYGGLVVAAASVATALVPVATRAGTELQQTLGASARIERHSDLGSTMIWGAVPLLLVSLALWWVGSRVDRDRRVPRWTTVVIPVLGVVVAAVALVQIVLIGHSGATAVWG